MLLLSVCIASIKFYEPLPKSLLCPKHWTFTDCNRCHLQHHRKCVSAGGRASSKRCLINGTALCDIMFPTQRLHTILSLCTVECEADISDCMSECSSLINWNVCCLISKFDLCLMCIHPELPGAACCSFNYLICPTWVCSGLWEAVQILFVS